MHIPVKVTTQATLDPCKYCKADAFKPRFLFTIELREGVETIGPYCSDCLGRMEMTAMIEPPPVPKGGGPPSHKMRRRVRNQEREIAEDMGGRQQPGSGNQARAKGDVRAKGRYRIEAKLTKSGQYVLKRTTLEKIMGECSDLERPGLILDYVDHRTLRSISRWAVIPYEDFIDLSGKREPVEK